MDDSDAAKHERARHVIERHWSQLVISTQVLAEFHAVCSRKPGLIAERIAESANDFAMLDVVPTDARSVLRAISIADNSSLTTFDAMIAESAERGGCELLLTEDAAFAAAELPFAVENPFA